MRARWIGAALSASVMAIVLAMPAQAQQSPLDGPLAAPDSAPKSSPVKPKPHKAHHAKAKKAPAATQDAAVPHQAPGETPAARAASPVDGIDLGMKWNGSNDTAAQTRFQNGPSNAFGSGAEVGMKLHF